MSQTASLKFWLLIIDLALRRVNNLLLNDGLSYSSPAQEIAKSSVRWKNLVQSSPQLSHWNQTLNLKLLRLLKTGSLEGSSTKELLIVRSVSICATMLKAAVNHVYRAQRAGWRVAELRLILLWLKWFMYVFCDLEDHFLKITFSTLTHRKMEA